MMSYLMWVSLRVCILTPNVRDKSFCCLSIQLAVICICTFVILPLTLVGTVLGRNLAGQPNYPCRINAVPRPIPEKKWFMEPLVIIPLGGILPFGSIFIEM